MLCLYYSYYAFIPNYVNTVWSSANRTHLKKLQSQQKYAIRIIFCQNKFAHTRVSSKENDILNI